MSGKHTPGPWVLSESGGQCVRSAQSKKRLGYFFWMGEPADCSEEEMCANAALIAAAPETAAERDRLARVNQELVAALGTGLEVIDYIIAQQELLEARCKKTGELCGHLYCEDIGCLLWKARDVRAALTRAREAQ